ncbi:MAG: SusC/RagA family TonB-linked outer membrane protein [Paludibacter sp.]|jgi:TonB-linked SusC/RagA family outer membrane protein|nr:SusC/RagA family TonB-linked outer membrane protein [Paludibacter sp.]
MKKSLIIFLFTLFAVGNILAQGKTAISGTVLNSLGKPVEGAIVTILGENLSHSDAEGKFSMQVSNINKAISIWATGYFSVTQAINGRSEIVVVMIPEERAKYNESAVLPFSIEENRPELTSAVNIAKKDFTLGGTTIDRLLIGQAAGLRTSAFSGAAGEGTFLNMRGIRSLVGENSPLIVINGVPYLPDNKESMVINGLTRNVLQSYNIQDIQNITVLKGAQASMYGSLGSNGVILIETDGATSNDLNTKISFYGQYGSSWNDKRIPMLSGKEYTSYLSDIGMNYFNNMESFFAEFPFMGNPNSKYSYFYKNNTDWQSQIYQNGFVTDNLFRIEGGDAIAKYDFSLGYALNEGNIKNTNAQRYNAQLNTNILVNKQIQIFTTVGLAYLTGQHQEQGMVSATNPILAAYQRSPLLSPYGNDEMGRDLATFSSYNYGISTNRDFAVSNPLAIVDKLKGIDARNRQYDVNIRAGITYSPTVHLSFTGTFGLFYNFNSEDIFLPGTTVLPIVDQYGEAVNSKKSGRGEALNYFYSVNGNYNRTFNDVHRVKATLGVQSITTNREYDGGNGRNTANDFYQTLGNTQTIGRYFVGYLEKWNWLNVFAHADYIYNNMVAVSGNLALDAMSAAGASTNHTAVYPSLSATWLGKGWLPLSNSTFVNRLNVRAEYGVTGNSNFSSNYGKFYYTSLPYQSISGIVRAGIANTNLKPEQNTQFNLSLEASLLKNRVDFTVDLYSAQASDVIIPVPQSSVYGSAPYYDNSATISNQGIEVSLQASLIRTRDVEWIIGGNFATNKSVVKSLGDGQDQIITSFDDGAQLITKVGESPYQFYGYKANGVYSTEANAVAAGLVNKKSQSYHAGDVIFENQNTDNRIDDDDRVMLGTAAPEFFGGIFTSIRVKHFELAANVYYSKGNKAYNAVRRSLESVSNFSNQSSAANGRWNVEHQVTDVPRAQWGDPIGNADFSSRWIEDASYLRLRNITLSYNFDKKILNFFRSGTLYVTGENLFTFTNYLGLDPEFSYSYNDALQGFDYAKTAQPKVVKLGVNLKF